VVRFSLDSSTIVDLIRDEKPHVRRRLAEALARGDDVAVSAIVLDELAFGALRSPRPEYHLNLLDGFISDFSVEPWTADDALATARLRADLENAGDRIGAYDAMIAGQAINRGWTVVSGDLREFIRVPNLQLLDWSDPSGPVDRATAWMKLVQRTEK
jgi:tRNA(fMet)-specific endonuclease VapC